MDRKIKVLSIYEDNGGVSYFRCTAPGIKLDEMHPDEFDIDLVKHFDWNDTDRLENYDIITMNRGDIGNKEASLNAIDFCKMKGIKFVLDLDDYWRLPETNPLYMTYKAGNISDYTAELVRKADYVTVTTDILAEKVRKVNPNVLVVPNSISMDDKQFQPCTPSYTPERRLRIGFVLGSSHLYDMKLLDGITRSLSPGIADKVQFVLCGFDNRGMIAYTDQSTGEVKTRDMYPTETVWFKYENILTDGYRMVSKDYRDHLLKFSPNVQYDDVENEIYRREWTKSVSSYGTHYDNIDVLFVPLIDNEFNSCKSELKLIEAGFKNVPAVVSNVGPYRIGTESILMKGGKVNENGNCILIDPSKNHKDWAKAIKKLVEHPEYMDIMRDNLRKHILDNYKLEDVNEKRADLYRKLVK